MVSGGKGADQINFDAGTGNDIAAYSRLSDSKAGHSDTIYGAGAGDVIDLSRIDADKHTAGNQAFVLVETLSGAEGEATFDYADQTGMTTLTLETNGRDGADMVIICAGDASDAGFVL